MPSESLQGLFDRLTPVQTEPFILMLNPATIDLSESHALLGTLLLVLCYAVHGRRFLHSSTAISMAVITSAAAIHRATAQNTAV